jgi:hypothetical protein
MEADYAGKGSAETGDTYAKHALAYLATVKARGLTLGTVPPNDMETWLDNAFASIVTRNVAAAALRALITTAQRTGYPMTAQAVTRKKAPKKEPAPMIMSQPVVHQPPPNGAVATGPQVADPGAIVYGSAQSTVDAAAAAAQGGMSTIPPLSRPAGIQHPPNGSNQRVTPVLPPLGGRVRISKRLDGYEGVSAPIGTRAVMGDYTMEDVSVEGDVMKFILNAIRPHFGPKIGQPPATYYVERLDERGNVMQNSLQAVPVFPDVAMGGMGGPAVAPAPVAAPAPAPAPAAPAMTPDREDTFIRYLMDNQKRAEEKYEALLTEIRSKQSQGGSSADLTTLMLLADKMKPEPLDLDAAVAKFRKANPPPPAPEPTPSPFHGAGMPSGHFGGGLAGLLDPTPPPPSASEKMIESLFSTVKDLNQQVRDLAVRAATPPPVPPPPPATDPLAIITGFAAAMKAFAPPPDPLREAMLSKLIAETGKTKSLAETLADLRAVQQFVGGDSGGGIQWGEIIANAVDNLPQILQGIAGMKAPVIPPQRPGSRPAAPRPPASAPQAGAQAQAQPQRTVLPDAAKKLFRDLVAVPAGEENDQKVVETLYGLLGALSQAPDPYPLIAKRVVETYLKLDTKAEIRAIVTNLFVWCGAARTLMTDAVLDRITEALHAHYTLIFAALTDGQTRTLKDAVQPTADAPAGEQPAAAVPEGDVVPCGDCGHPDHGAAACGYCKADHACAQPAEEDDEDDEAPEEPAAAGTPPVAKF